MGQLDAFAGCMKRELLIGCGSQRKKLFGEPKWSSLTTLDVNQDHGPDVRWDLTELPLPFTDDFFDEIHAYEVLEHTGAQGDYRFFFAQFSDFWRLLKPGGLLCATVPAPPSPWVWGDPSHTRVIQPETLVFLDQTEYTAQIGKTVMSDFRHIYKADFRRSLIEVTEGTLAFVLQAVKPSRITRP